MAKNWGWLQVDSQQISELANKYRSLGVDHSLIKLSDETSNVADTLIAASWSTLKSEGPAKPCFDPKELWYNKCVLCYATKYVVNFYASIYIQYTWKESLVLNQVCGSGDQELHMECVGFEMSIKHSGEHVGYVSLDFRREIWKDDINLEINNIYMGFENMKIDEIISEWM